MLPCDVCSTRCIIFFDKPHLFGFKVDYKKYDRHICNGIQPGHVFVLSCYLHDFLIVLEDVTACTNWISASFYIPLFSQYGNINAHVCFVFLFLGICIHGCSSHCIHNRNVCHSLTLVGLFCVSYCIFEDFTLTLMACFI